MRLGDTQVGWQVQVLCDGVRCEAVPGDVAHQGGDPRLSLSGEAEIKFSEIVHLGMWATKVFSSGRYGCLRRPPLKGG